MINQLKAAIESLHEDEAKTLLYQMLLKINMAEETGYTEKQCIKDLQKTSQDILQFKRKQILAKNEYEAVHIVFGDAAGGSLRMALKKMGRNEREKIISFSDLFSIGPVWNLNKEIGLHKRYTWLENHLIFEDGEIESGIMHFQDTLREMNSLPPSIPITIWTGDNSHEQTGLRFVLYVLKEKGNDVFSINSATAYKKWFTHPEIEYDPLHTGELSPEKLKSMYEKSSGAASLSQEERKKLTEEWVQLSATQEVLRIWENGHIQSVKEDYYDEYIINTCQHLHNEQQDKGFMKSARLIGEVMGHLQQYHGDAYFEYRVRHLIENGVFERQGVPKAMRFYSIKLR